MGGPVRAINPQQTQHDLLDEAALQTMRAVCASGAAVYLFLDGSLVDKAREGRARDWTWVPDLPDPPRIGRPALAKGELEAIEQGEKVLTAYPELYGLGVRALAAFPLELPEGRQGALYLYFDEERKLRGAELDLVRSITGIIQGVMVNRELLEEIVGSAKWGWMTASQQPVIQSLVSDRDLQFVLADLVQSIELALGASSVVLYPYLQSTDEFVEPVHYGVTSHVATQLKQDSVPRRLLAEGSTKFIVDLARERWIGQRPAGFASRESIRSCAAVILRAQKATEIVGVMFINYGEKQTFPPEIRDAIASLASSAAIAIQAARLQRRANPALHDLRTEFAALLEIDDLIARSLENPRTDEVLEMILKHAVASISVKDAAIYLVRGDGQMLEMQCKAGFPDLDRRPLLKGEGIVGRAALGAALIDNCIDRGTRPSEIAVPLIAQKDVLGVIHLAHPDPQFFTRDHQDWLQTLGMQGVIAIRSLESFEALQAPLRAITKVASLLQHVDGDLTMLLKLVLTGITAKQGLGFTRAMIFRLAEDKRSIEGLTAIGPRTGTDAKADWAETDQIEQELEEKGLDVLDALLQHALQSERNLKAGGARRPLDDRTTRYRMDFDSDDDMLFTLASKGASQAIAKPEDGALGALVRKIGLELEDEHALAFVPLVESKSRRLGFLIADRAYQQRSKPVQNVDLKNLEAFGEWAVLALKSESLRGTLRDEHRMEEWAQYMADTMHALTGALSDARSWVVKFREEIRKSAQGPPQVSAFIERLQDHHGRVQRVANSLRQYARPALGSFRRINLNEVVVKAASNHPAILQTLPDEPVTIVGDPERIGEILANLITNSREAAAETSNTAGLRIEAVLRVVRNALSEKWAFIEVRDNAGGIPAGILADVLRPWYTTKGKGRGMGLPIAKKIAEAHGGILNIESELGSGTIVHVGFPMQSDRGGNEGAETTLG
jgi:signal transduction histidine kinase